ncbi:hypothetical protein KMZ68_02100 [Bradyrhizobium sediminis]|uniref:Uncharacterized protein n=1 Tax=Bradyrhizobium sediminis TaxID=2840469 RepID=A0A975NP11_9BRAD|nr:hypothetical protein [Bradyrhizobium sediminis]QWG18713.1 hypothetical protein KMZ68_02100 [Bradyrhizobium sediminis]
MSFQMRFVRPPTAREKEAMRSKAKAKAAKEAQRLADAAKKAVADAEADAKAKAEAEAMARDVHYPANPFGLGQRFRAVNLVWREWASGATHVEAIATGFEAPDREGHAEVTERVEATLAFQAEHGQRFSKFFVNKDGERIGSGFFDSNVTAADIPYLFAKLAARGFEGHVAYSDPDTGALSLDGYPPVGLPMPAFEGESFSLELDHGHDAASPTEYLRFEANEQLPDGFAVMWHAERDRYAKILASCKPRNFLIYDVRAKADCPMAIYEMRGEHLPFKFAKVGEAVASDGEGGGFVATAHGSFFDDTPSAETLAFISCRLAASGRWLVLVPHQYDFVTPEVYALMSGTTIHAE